MPGIISPRTRRAAQQQVHSYAPEVAQLFGLIDPSDGIAYREAALDADPPDRRRRGAGERCIYLKGNRWRVRVRLHGVLVNLHYWRRFADARRARDGLYAAAYGKHWKAIVANLYSARPVNWPAVERFVGRLRLQRLRQAPRG